MRAVAFFRSWPMLTRTALAFALLGGVALPNRHAGLFSNHPDPLAARAEHSAAWNRVLGLRPPRRRSRGRWRRRAGAAGPRVPAAGGAASIVPAGSPIRSPAQAGPVP
ncbi:hypothetical protein [Allosphingosinicella deserti]|uniref:Uncharacterized protein n=1 Tax=Allosphingosinicella deserti TaxID=2116704 RepID=A0A2P7QRM5_9SPHN|nr:hypothetical protein [Sphingomonas deserti]PSJ40580.1 hypothetical protein C7I55_09645 [Sphingomonas deserti]